MGLALLATSSSNGGAEQAASMDLIERTVVMPAGSAPIARYARFYTRAPTGAVVGLFVIGPHGGLDSGKRRWVSTLDYLPWIADGGCAAVNVSLEAGSTEADTASCNGGG